MKHLEIEADMIAFKGYLLNQHFTVTLDQKGSDRWTLKVWDQPTNTTTDCVVTTSEVGAMLALSAGLGEEEGPPSEIVAYLYTLVEPVMKRLGDDRFRLIP